MLNRVSTAWPDLPLLYRTAYLVLAIVAVFELLVVPSASTQRATVGFLSILGILLAARPFFKVFSWQTHLYMVLLAAVVISLLLLRPGSLMLPMLFCVLSMLAALSLPLRSAALWIVIFILLNTFYCASLKHEEPERWLTPLPYAVGYIFCGISAYSLARTSAAQRRSQTLLEELQATYQQLQEYASRVEELAVSQERNRLAREMHDALGHRLTVAAVQLEGAERLIPTDPLRAGRIVNTVHEEVVEALAELRRAVATLRTPLDVDLSLPTALTRLAQGFEEATGIKVNRSLPEELLPLSEAQRLAFYRAAQEALTNVQRHAHARQVWLELALENGTVTLLVKDDGQGFDPEAGQPGFGLRSLRERAAHLNGQFHLESNPGEGTQICFHLPLPEDNAGPLSSSQVESCGWKLFCPPALHPVRPDGPAVPSTSV